MNNTFFMPETFPHHSWTPQKSDGWVERFETFLDWILGIDE